jgi:hypothetical protein
MEVPLSVSGALKLEAFCCMTSGRSKSQDCGLQFLSENFPCLFERGLSVMCRSETVLRGPVIKGSFSD